LVLMARRTSISLITLFSSDDENLARGWLMCVFVLVAMLTLQVYAKPYRDGADDLCEFLSLLSTLVIYISGGAMVLGSGEEEVGADEAGGGGTWFEQFLSAIVIIMIVTQTIVCIVVQSVQVGMAKVDKITIVHAEVNVASKESQNIDVVARLCSLASKRDSQLYCPDFDLLKRVWLREGGLGDELDLDEYEIEEIVRERGEKTVSLTHLYIYNDDFPQTGSGQT